MSFDDPLLLALAIPALYVVWRYRVDSKIANTVRTLLALLLVVALAGPLIEQSAVGRDVIFVVDRSRSMPASAGDAAMERIRLAEEVSEDGDRIGVVTFGSDARIEALPDEETRAAAFALEVDPDGTDLAQALDTALELASGDRPASIFVLSDGEIRGRDPLPAARRARSRGVDVHVLPLTRPPAPDVSVERIELPAEVGAGEPFQFNAWLRADKPGVAAYVLMRDGETIAEGAQPVRSGWNRMLFRDILDEPGIGVYTLRIADSNDRVPENDIGLGAVHVRGSKPILILNQSGEADALSELWRTAGLDVVVARPEDVDLSPIGLTAYRAVVLENLPARRVESDMKALAEFVEERGGGLLMTGGKASFGIGGYHETPIDEILPVSMMLKNEDRKVGVAIAFVLDRSGSMGMQAGNSGRTKMDLANLGTMAAIELLGPIDAATVIAVDSSPHEVMELTPVESPDEFRDLVLSIESGGGGIFVRTGLDAAVESLAETTHANRHIVLFADAQDAEEPDGVVDLVTELEQTANTTTSVIALGTEMDVDARFLSDIAKAGAGSIYFTTSPSELPAMFARDTMTIARSAFLEQATDAEPSPALYGLGELELQGFPTIPGYNLNYAKLDTDIGISTTDEHVSPLFAFHQRGLGRVAAFGAEVGGRFGQPILEWEEAGLFFVTLGRWLAGQEEPDTYYPTVTREGRSMVVGIEVDRETSRSVDTAGLLTRVRDMDGSWHEHPLERVSDDRFEARIEVSGPGVHLGTLLVPDDEGGTEAITLPPMSLPYSPEFERPYSAEAGETLLEELARAGGGLVRPRGDLLWPTNEIQETVSVLSRPLAIAAIVILLLMIAGRRLGLWGSLEDWSRGRAVAREERAKARAKAAAEAPTPAPVSEHAPRAQPHTPARAARTGQAETSSGSFVDALGAAKARADKRTERREAE